MLLIYFQDDLTIIRSTVGAATLIVLFRFPDDRDLNRYSGSTGSKDPVMLPEKICDDTETGQQLNNRIKIHASSFQSAFTDRSERIPRIRKKQAHQRIDDCG